MGKQERDMRAGAHRPLPRALTCLKTPLPGPDWLQQERFQKSNRRGSSLEWAEEEQGREEAETVRGAIFLSGWPGKTRRASRSWVRQRKADLSAPCFFCSASSNAARGRQNST